MKIVLIKDLKGKGKKGDIINVNDGYAHNFLIPNGYAILGSNSNINQANQAKASNAYHEEQLKLQAIELKRNIEELHLLLKVKCGQNGKIFGSVTNKEIAENLSKKGYQIDKKKIETDIIKSTGIYAIKIKLHPDVSAKLKIEIIAE